MRRYDDDEDFYDNPRKSKRDVLTLTMPMEDAELTEIYLDPPPKSSKVFSRVLKSSKRLSLFSPTKKLLRQLSEFETLTGREFLAGVLNLTHTISILDIDDETKRTAINIISYGL